MTMARRRGQPLIALVLMMGSWVAVRAYSPGDAGFDAAVPLPPNVVDRVGEPAVAFSIAALPPPANPSSSTPSLGPEARRSAPVTSFALAELPRHATGLRRSDRIVIPLARVPSARRQWASAAPPPPTQGRTGQTPALPVPARRERTPPAVPFSATPPGLPEKRWSGDGWVLWRRDGGSGRAASVGGSSYGASQAGAVLRYRLAPESGLDPQAHLRVTGALEGAGEAEVAAGVGIRPLREVPLQVMVEGRIGRFAGDTRVRPAAIAVIGPPPQDLPVGLEAEIYAQAGYVGGEGATGFADGQLRVTRDLMRKDGFRVAAGAGAWGGIQDGAERLDVGPTVSVSFPLGNGVFARAGADWRQRIAGNASPGSGPVLTVAAGF